MSTHTPRRIAAVLAAVLCLSVALPAYGSVPVHNSDEDPATVTLSSQRLDVPEPARGEYTGEGVRTGGGARTMWTWSAGRRGYFLGDIGAETGFATIASVDLDTLKDVAQAPLDPPALGTGHNMAGHSQLVTVDEVDGRLMVAAEVGTLKTDFGQNDTLGGLAAEDDERLVEEGNYPEGMCEELPDGAEGSAAWTAKEQCRKFLNEEPQLLKRKAPGPQLVPPGGANLEFCPSIHTTCFGGLTVLDAESLQTLRTIPYQPVQIDGGAVVPFLRALTYEPARQAGDVAVPGKAYAIIEEAASFVQDPRMTRTYVNNVVYAVQFDPESGRQDWAFRLDQCRGARESRNDGTNLVELRALPHAASIHRTVRDGRPAIVVGCHSGGTQVGTVVRIPLTGGNAPQPVVGLPEAPGVPDSGATPSPDSVAALVPQTGDMQTYAGPDKVWEILADPVSDRVLMKVVDGNPNSEVWWVFDGSQGRFAGTIGIGTYGNDASVSALDTVRGRLYVRAPETPRSAGGLFVADIRRTPLSQALVFPDIKRQSSGGQMVVDLGAEGRPTRVFAKLQDQVEIIEDRLPVSTDLPIDEFVGRTLDLDEVEGVTASTFDGVARGYGMRALFVGGFEAATRVGPADPVGQVFGAQKVALDTAPFKSGGAANGLVQDGTLPLTSPCTEANREVVLGMVGPEAPAVVDGSGTRGAAEPIMIDTGLRAESEAPVSRCSPVQWDEVWRNALFGNPPVGEPTTKWSFGDGEAACVSTDDKREGSFGDAVTGGFAAQVRCEDQSVSGWSYARGVSLEGGVAVGEASSRFTVYRDPARGVVSRVESATRGIQVPGAFSVEVVRAVAESWANGRAQPVAAADRDAGYDPNCDMDRTAGTCFWRRIGGVSSPHFSCAQCSDQQALIKGLNSALGAQGSAQLREPDPRLAKGAENGFTAAVKKPDAEQFADLVLNNDLLQTVVPGLEIVRYAQPNRVLGGGGQRGRQIYQFAGVEVSSGYGISCLLVYDAAAGTCGAAKEAPGSITVSLADPDGKPLAGGAFEVRLDGDGDGVAGLKDALIPNGACLTAADGVGTCRFEALQPGAYLVTQIAAPGGFAKQADPYKVDLASGEARTVAFQNVSNVSVVQVKATDEAGKPLAGAVFSVMPDPDADGKVAADAKPAASCTTDASGTCAMQVPAGSYVLVQTGATGGLAPIEPVAFTLASGGQTAAVGVVNYPQGMPAAPPAAAPVYSEPVAAAPPVETVEAYEPPVAEDAGGALVDVPQAIGGTIVRIIAAPGDTLRLLAREPKEAVAWIASLALFAAALLAVRRRQAAMALVRAKDDVA